MPRLKQPNPSENGHSDANNSAREDMTNETKLDMTSDFLVVDPTKDIMLEEEAPAAAVLGPSCTIGDPQTLVPDKNIISDKPYRCSWQEKLLLQSDLRPGVNIGRATPDVVHQWKGALWSALLALSPEHPHNIGCFVGIDDAQNNMPPGFNLTVAFKTTLVYPDGSPVPEAGVFATCKLC